MKLAILISSLVWPTVFGDGVFAPFKWIDLSKLLNKSAIQ
jgi:hypothetical protein